METAMSMGIKEERKKRRKKRRRIRRMIFLALVLAFFIGTQAGQDLVHRATELEFYQVIGFLKRGGLYILGILPKARDILADKLTYIANFL